MKIDVGYTHTEQNYSEITIDDADYLSWCREFLRLPESQSDERLLKNEGYIIRYLNYDTQFLNELIGWGQQNTIAFDIDFEE